MAGLGQTVGAIYSPPSPAFFTAANCVISTVPSGERDFRFSAHGFHEILEHADVHVRAAFQLRDCGLHRPPRATAIPFASLSTCHPEAPSFGAEGPIQPAGCSGGVGECIDPSSRKERGPQDDKRGMMTRERFRHWQLAGRTKSKAADRSVRPTPPPRHTRCSFTFNRLAPFNPSQNR